MAVATATALEVVVSDMDTDNIKTVHRSLQGSVGKEAALRMGRKTGTVPTVGTKTSPRVLCATCGNARQRGLMDPITVTVVLGDPGMMEVGMATLVEAMMVVRGKGMEEKVKGKVLVSTIGFVGTVGTRTMHLVPYATCVNAVPRDQRKGKGKGKEGKAKVVLNEEVSII